MIGENESKVSSPRIVTDMYSAINSHMITALMLHDQMADLYDFLDLHGFKRMHEYQYLAESIERRKLKRYVLNHHNRLIMDNSVENPKVVPVEWYEYTRFDVNPQVREQGVKRSFQKYREWEAKTKEKYCSACKILIENGSMADYEFVSELLKDVDEELKTLERLYLELEACNYDVMYVLSIQDRLHKKYKKKTKELSL